MPTSPDFEQTSPSLGDTPANTLPTLLRCVRNDDITGLATLLDTADSPAQQPSFWSGAWPKLLQVAAKKQHKKSLNFLLDLRDKGNKSAPLPPHFLAWILAGIQEKRKLRYSSLDLETRLKIFRRIDNSPQQFSKQDGMRILLLGGLNGAFFQFQSDKEKTGNISEHPHVVTAWKAWCANHNHQREGITLLVDVQAETPLKDRHLDAIKPSVLDSRMAFISLYENAPQADQPKIMAVLLDTMSASPICQKQDDQTLSRLSRWHFMFQKQGWPTDHPLWTDWARRLCQNVAKIENPEDDRVRTWTSALLYETVEKLGDGWHWNPGVARGYLIGKSDTLTELFKRQDSSTFIPTQLWAQTSTWLRETRLAWEKLEANGIVSLADWEAWKRQQHVILGKDWEARMEQLLIENADDKEAKSSNVFTQWSAWKAHSLQQVVAMQNVDRLSDNERQRPKF